MQHAWGVVAPHSSKTDPVLFRGSRNSMLKLLFLLGFLLCLISQGTSRSFLFCRLVPYTALDGGGEGERIVVVDLVCSYGLGLHVSIATGAPVRRLLQL